MEGYPTDYYFLTGQTYDNIILAGHSIIISMKLYAIYYPHFPYEPWTLGLVLVGFSFQVYVDFAVENQT